jgi:hypothetical protein
VKATAGASAGVVDLFGHHCEIGSQLKIRAIAPPPETRQE